MWKKPFRPKNEISQTFNDGVVRIYRVSDDAKPGDRAKERLEYAGMLYYEEMRVGVQRYYAAAQNQIKVARVIRCQAGIKVTTQHVAITEDGEQYRIDMVQKVQSVLPESIDLTLVAIKQKYELDVR